MVHNTNRRCGTFASGGPGRSAALALGLASEVREVEVAYRCFGIECENAIQGLMMTSTAKYTARVEPDIGKPLIYIEYLETSPWNVRPIVEEPKYGGVGIRLFEAAVRYSQIEGFHGRVGLHSLPQAEKFYAQTCGMTTLGSDSRMEDLSYFEFTRDQALQFLSEEETS